MASTERSLGWATSGTGDGPAGGYDSTRWRANAQKSDGNGILLTGSNMAMSGTSTSTLTIADGAALINGYTYETNGAVTISTSGLNGSYSVVLIANTSAGTVTVTANGAGTTTVAASTVRTAIVTTAQLSTITTAVGTANVITLSSIFISSGTIVTINGLSSSSFTADADVPYVSLPALTPSINAVMYLPSTSTVNNTTATLLTGFGSVTTTNDKMILYNAGTLFINQSGGYMLDVRVNWDSNTTGTRAIIVTQSGNITPVADTLYNAQSASVIAAYSTSYLQQMTALITASGPANFTVSVWQNSGSARTISNAFVRLVRM